MIINVCVGSSCHLKGSYDVNPTNIENVFNEQIITKL